MSRIISYDKVYKLWSYVDPLKRIGDDTLPPISIDWQTDLIRDIYKQTIINKGERVSSVFYGKFAPETEEYSEKLFRIDYGFERNSAGLLLKRTKVISWVLQDGSYGDEPKIQTKYITNERERLREIKIRRSNIIDELKGVGAQYNLSQHLIPFFEQYQLLVNQYIDSGSQNLRDAIAASDEEWLDTPHPLTGNKPRDVFILYFSI